jgi:enoyl-CoA hydratase/carnithine racemase/3-hydroxyacyl-CoA dehydrogenase
MTDQRPDSTAGRATAMRPSTLEQLGLGSPFEIFRSGRLPVSAAEMVARVFGPEGDRGALVISGANGIVGAGKTMQLGARLQPFGVPIVALDLAGAPDGLGSQYKGLVRAFGREQADRIMDSIVRLTYDGKSLPSRLAEMKPRFLLEAIPEILELKRAHYAMFRAAFPEIEIRSVTSGFPSHELGVGIAHPAFPHQINKIFETVEAGPSEIDRLLWALGLIPMPVSDDWSFVLYVVFCGLMNNAIRYHRATNMPYWKVDKLVRKAVGPNPFRAHDAIGAKGANFLTWSCLHHLGEQYGALFTPAPELTERKETGQDWYPPNHFRPLVDWTLDEDGSAEFEARVVGPLLQMTSLMLHEDRAHLSNLNAIGEICAQLRSGVLAMVRRLGANDSRELVGRYHALDPAAAERAWHPEQFDRIDSPEWQQLYVNAEHDGTVGLVTLGREAYNWDVDAELNRALDWLQEAGIERLIVSSDFHLAGQLVGADTAEFFPAFEDEQAGYEVSAAWTRTARRLAGEFAVSVGVIPGKRCLGGMLELMLHCHYLLATDETSLGLPEVTLPVVPGMEGCHWPYRRVEAEHWPRLASLMLDGRPVRGGAAEGWLIDRAGSVEEMVSTAWAIASGGEHGVERRPLAAGSLDSLSRVVEAPEPTGDSAVDAAREAIWDTVIASTGATLDEALEVQSRCSAAFFASSACRRGIVGTLWRKTTQV